MEGIRGSGFDVGAHANRNGGFELHGVGGRTLAQACGGGMRTVLRMFTHGFPNLGIINGLKQAAATWNITVMMRRQSEHFAAVVKKCLDGNIKTFDAKPAAQEIWFQWRTNERATLFFAQLRARTATRGTRSACRLCLTPSG
jgi:cation diffusion facilitator CzcD-associated flavoprotein CzcO